MAEEAQSLGQALQAGREARGLSREEVAKALRLSISTVRRLENEDWETMPAPVFVRGYVSSYARLVGLDADALLNLYKVVDVRSSTEPRIELTSVDGDHKGSRAPWIFAGTALVAAAVVAVSLLLVLPEVEERTAEGDVADADAAAEAAAQVAEVAAPEAAAPAVPAVEEVSPDVAAEQAPQAAATPEAPIPEAPIPQTPTPEATTPQAPPAEAPPSEVEPDAFPEQSEAAPEPSEEAPEEAGFASRFGEDEPVLGALEAPPVEEEGGVFRVTPAGDDEIEFVFSETCWVEVKDLDGRYLHAVLGEPNERLTLVGEGPFDVKLGYVPGVVLRFNGAPVPLAAHTRDHVANLVLGR